MFDPEKIAFVDIETTGLSDNCAVWEIAIIDNTGEYCWQQVVPITATVDQWVIDHGFKRYDKYEALSQVKSADMIDGLLSGVHIVGLCPWFDAGHLQKVLSQHHVDYLGTNRFPWHYHLIDLESAMLGFLANEGREILLPWKSDDLSRRIGVQPPDPDLKHTALEDARWAKRIYEAIF